MTNLRLTVEGMSCGHCVSRVHQSLSANPGTRVLSVDVGKATLEYDPALTSPETIAQRLTEAGYPASPSAPAGS
ncbi:MAG: heavy-metal-associated domain-containing protein [Gemmatimonadales bacterium]|nr:heavy-metal-associated domain-containing protein [Gemmatimonadales bacterium]